LIAAFAAGQKILVSFIFFCRTLIPPVGIFLMKRNVGFVYSRPIAIFV
jgi:hypothetical protein